MEFACFEVASKIIFRKRQGKKKKEKKTLQIIVFISQNKLSILLV
jgi:hypothetical protein